MGVSRHDQLKKAIESCEFAESNILGVIFNVPDSKTIFTDTGTINYSKIQYSKKPYSHMFAESLSYRMACIDVFFSV